MFFFSYTNRSLYYAIKDMEGIQQFVNVKYNLSF